MAPPWWDGVPPEKLGEIRARYPGRSLEDVGILAVEHPDYAEDFARLGAEVIDAPEVNPWGIPKYPRKIVRTVHIPPPHRTAIRDLIVAVMR